MGVFSQQNLIILSLILAIFALILSFFNVLVLKKLNNLKKLFLTTKEGESLEGFVGILTRNLHDLQSQQLYLENSLVGQKIGLEQSLQKIGLVKFNPFPDAGGNLSFCLAILDGEDDGVVITSMHGREQNRIYAKKIIGGKTEIALTQEEKQAIFAANAKFIASHSSN